MIFRTKYPSIEARDAAWKEAKRAWEKRNKETLLTKKAIWYAENKDRIAERRKADRKRHYDKNTAKCIAYARKRQGKIKQGNISMNQAEQAEVQGMYDFCKIFKGFEVDHIIPLNGKEVSGLHVLGNLQVLPISINRSKSNKYKEADNA